MSAARPIGVFDSGIGGLTVLRALRARLPHENLLYLGDTARLPYGTKSSATVAAYAIQAASLLVQRGVKMVVIACNTASAVALDALAAALAPIPVIGVVEPGAIAGAGVSRNGHIGVIATEGTVRGGAYVRAIHAINPGLRVSQAACTVFVALAEEGWVDGPVFEGAARRYLDPLFAHTQDRPDTLLLGCTHFPPLAPALGALLGPGVRLVDSAQTTAATVADALQRLGLVRSAGAGGGKVNFIATDSPERFIRTGQVFLGAPIAPEAVETADL